MTDSQRHRGPDGHGLVLCQPIADDRPAVALGHTRLAILDLSSEAGQPMAEADAWITYNGETYNFRLLRAALEAEGHRFRSQSDTEVVLRAYRLWNAQFVHRLRGMFALAVWDARRQTLLLARDRLGIKPLYYYEGRDFLLFASEVRALLASGLVPRRLDPVSVDQYLAYQTVPAPRTLVEGVRMLAPGHAMTVDRLGRTTIDRYWDLLGSASREAADVAPEESGRRVAALLQESAALHLVSDVPVGVFLSGGIDSSALVSLMREGGVTPQTFSVSFKERDYDESLHAGAVAEHFQTDHTEIRVDAGDLCACLPDLFGAFDHPSGDAINTGVISRAVHAAGMKVALSGLGGDEIFGGYPSFGRMSRFNDWLPLWRRTPEAIRTLAAAGVERFGASSAAAKAGAILRTDGSLAQAFPPLRQLFSEADRRRLLSPAVGQAADQAGDPYVALLDSAFTRDRSVEVGSRVSYAEARTYMHDVLLRDTDQMSMAFGLEVRVPLLDHKLVEYVIGLPDALKFELAHPKALLTDSLGLRLPESVVRRPKQGFTLPFDTWMRGPLRSFCEDHLDGRLADRGLFDPAAVDDLWRRFLSRDRRVTWSRPWALVALSAWVDRHDMSLS